MMTLDQLFEVIPKTTPGFDFVFSFDSRKGKFVARFISVVLKSPWDGRKTGEERFEVADRDATQAVAAAYSWIQNYLHTGEVWDKPRVELIKKGTL